MMSKTSHAALPGWLWLMVAAGILTQTTANLVRPVTSYKLLLLGWGETEIGIATAAYALLPRFFLPYLSVGFSHGWSHPEISLPLAS